MKRYIKSAYIPNRYDEKTREIIDKMEGDRNISFNTLYHRADNSMNKGVCFYENTKGYVHVVMPGPEMTNEKIYGYCYFDYLLTNNGLKETARYDCDYDTEEECLQALLDACES